MMMEVIRRSVEGLVVNICKVMVCRMVRGLSQARTVCPGGQLPRQALQESGRQA